MNQTGYDYAPKGKPEPVCGPGDFKFGAVALDHGHIYGQCNGLIEAGGELCWVFDPDPRLVERFRATFPQAKVARPLTRSLRMLEFISWQPPLSPLSEGLLAHGSCELANITLPIRPRLLSSVNWRKPGVFRLRRAGSTWFTTANVCMLSAPCSPAT